MKTRRLTVVGLSVLAAVSLAIGGCAKNDTGSSAGASSSPSPKDPKSVLTTSVEQLQKTTYKYNIDSQGASGQGLADPANKAITLAMTMTEDGTKLKMDFVIIGTEYWLKMDLGEAGAAMGIPSGKYMHLDATKLGSDSALSDASEGADMTSDLFAGLLDVKQVDSQHLTGTIDLTKVGKDSEPTDETMQKAGDKAKAASFTAEVDSQGRLTSFKVDMAALGVNELLDATYSDYGAPVTINKPATSQIVEAPQSVYDMFKGDSSS